MRAYIEIHAEIENKRVKDKDFYCSDEYKNILYPEATTAYKAEGLDIKRNNKMTNKRRLNKMIRKGTIETGIPFGLFL